MTLGAPPVSNSNQAPPSARDASTEPPRDPHHPYMAGGIRLALAEVLVDELGHGVRDDAGEVKRQIEWTTPKRLVLELIGRPAPSRLPRVEDPPPGSRERPDDNR